MAAAKDYRKIAERYVTALFQLGEAEGALEKLYDELNALKTMLIESDDFRRMCLSPKMNRHAQHAGLKAIAEKSGLSLLLTRFLMILAENRRVGLLPVIVDGFIQRLHQHRGEIFAVVTSASKLKKAQTDKIAKLLEGHTGKKIIIDSHLDPTLLGGVRIQCDGLLIDATVNGQLDRLGDALYKRIQQAA